MAQNNQVKLLLSFAGDIQAVEDTLQQLYTLRSIDAATGVQLDMLGKIVGQFRGGMIDADYRRIIRAKISVNRSKGTVADILKVSKLVLDDNAVLVEALNSGPATVVVKFLDAAVTDDVAELAIQMLKKTVSGGVRLIVEWSSDPVGDWFIWGVSNWDEKKWGEAGP